MQFEPAAMVWFSLLKGLDRPAATQAIQSCRDVEAFHVFTSQSR